jgi:hypothetical protein
MREEGWPGSQSVHQLLVSPAQPRALVNTLMAAPDQNPQGRAECSPLLPEAFRLARLPSRPKLKSKAEAHRAPLYRSCSNARMTRASRLGCEWASVCASRPSPLLRVRASRSSPTRRERQRWIELSSFRRRPVFGLGDTQRGVRSASDLMVDFCHERAKVKPRKHEQGERDRILPPSEVFNPHMHVLARAGSLVTWRQMSSSWVMILGIRR